MYNLSRKNNLGKHLMDMRKKFPEYKFFPKTFMLPVDTNNLINVFNKNNKKIFIVKPVASSQG
jgi:tubulin polyglutamylase TTLL6/13